MVVPQMEPTREPKRALLFFGFFKQHSDGKMFFETKVILRSSAFDVSPHG